MNRAVYALASGGLAAQARLDAVTQNLANVGTAGYKAGRPVFRLRPLDVEEAGLPVPPALRAAAQVTEAETVRDFSQGPVHATGNPLDVAVTGEGFFVVATPRGERYTRQGGFGLDGEGYLVTEHGDRVQGDNGDLRLGSGDVAIGEDGQVNVDGLSVGRLKLVGFGERPGLVAEGNALFAPVRGVVPAPLGIEIAGSRGMPSDVTMRDWLSSLKAPARVKAVVPSGSVTSKKPVPSTARSSELPVCV